MVAYKHGGVKMKVRKAIKRIAALGIGASMMGATLMGAMAADLKDYPGMFITDDGHFDGLLVVGQEALATDTIGVTNIALGLQKAAVTKTLVCGSGSATRTSVSGEQVLIEKTGDELNINEYLADIQDTDLDDGDLPSILGDGTYDESEGETDNDVDYTQEIALGATSGEIVFAQDDDDAPESGVYLFFPKSTTAYTYTLEFDSEVEFDVDDVSADFESTSIEIQGQTYTITDAEDDGSGVIEKLTMLVGESVMWIAEGATVTKEVDGVEHTITMFDVANSDECGFEVDGSTVWIAEDETKSIGGITLGVTDALEVNSDKSDTDQCRVYLGAEELILEEGQEVDKDGDEVDGSSVAFTSAAGELTAIEISWEPDEDEYLAAGDELVDPVFGNFKFIMGGEVVTHEEIEFSASGSDGSMTFMNYEGDEVEIPFSLDEVSGDVYLGNTDDPTNDVSDVYYLEGDTCDGSGDVTECEGARFIAVTSGNVAHIIEITDIDEDDNEISFDDITTGGSTDNKDYSNGDIKLGSGVGTITLTINEGAGTIDFDDTFLDSGVIMTEYEAEIVISTTSMDIDDIVITENDEEDNEATFTVTFSNDEDTLEIDSPTVACSGAECGSVVEDVDFSDTDDDNQMFATEYGSIAKYDSDNKDALLLMHPEEQMYVDVFVAATDATTMEVEGSDGDCTTSEKLNPIPATVNKFDTEVSNPGAQNLVTVGGPCANSVTSQLMDNPEVCWAGFEEGKAMLKLVAGTGDNVALIVAGATGKDTQLASRILQDYEDYDLSGMEMVATTVSASGLKVEPKTASAPAEDDSEDDEMTDEE